MISMADIERFIRHLDVRMLKRFFEMHGDGLADIDWGDGGNHPVDDALSGRIMRAIHQLRKRDWDSYQRLYAKFIDIGILSEGWRMFPSRLWTGINLLEGAFKKHGLERKWKELAGLRLPFAEAGAMWIWIEANDVFRELLVRKLMHPKNSSDGHRYPMPAKLSGAPKMALDDFRKHIGDCVKREREFEVRVHVDRCDLGGCVRFVVNTDTLPPRRDAIFEVERNTPCLYITYMERFKLFAIRDYRFAAAGELTAGMRDQIAGYFAQDILGLCEAAETGKGKRGGTRKYSDKDEQRIIDFVEREEYELDRKRDGATCYNITKAALDWSREKHKNKRLPKTKVEFRNAYNNIKRRRRAAEHRRKSARA